MRDRLVGTLAIPPDFAGALRFEAAVVASGFAVAGSEPPSETSDP